MPRRRSLSASRMHRFCGHHCSAFLGFFEKPLREEGALSPHLCLCRAGLGCAVAGQGEHATSTFKIKRRMAMRKVFAACADKWRVPVATLKFTFDGEAIGGEDNADTV